MEKATGLPSEETKLTFAGSTVAGLSGALHWAVMVVPHAVSTKPSPGEVEETHSPLSDAVCMLLAVVNDAW